MKKFTKISLIVTAVMLGVGIICCGIASMMGAGFRTMRQMAQNGEFDNGSLHISPSGIYFGDAGAEWTRNDNTWQKNGTDGEGEWSEGTDEVYHSYESASVKNIVFDVEAAGIFVNESSEASNVSVELTHGREKYYKCSLNGDTLKISYKHHENNGYHNSGPRIDVTVPENTVFKNVELTVGAGEIDFCDAPLTCENLTIDVGAGEVKAEWLEVTEKADINVGAGEVMIGDGIFQGMNVECTMGHIQMDGTLNGNLNGNCAMGQMEINLSGNWEDYDYKLSCSMGEMKVNGEEYAGFAGKHHETNHHAVGTIKLDCSMGEVDLNID